VSLNPVKVVQYLSFIKLALLETPLCQTRVPAVKFIFQQPANRKMLPRLTPYRGTEEISATRKQAPGSTCSWPIEGAAVVEIDAALLPVMSQGECRVTSEHFEQSYAGIRSAGVREK
jgi:hypothetical protein